MNNDQILVGRTILAIKIADDKKAIQFQTDQGEIIAMVDGDCCSDTWIESIEVPALGLPALVVSADDLQMPDLGSQGDYEFIAYYGFKIVTDKGEIILDYRNSSNGYYGGNLSWPGDYHYGGVGGQNNSTQQWMDISDQPK